MAICSAPSGVVRSTIATSTPSLPPGCHGRQPSAIRANREDRAPPEGLRFHDLRHTCAAFLIAAGRHMEEVKDNLGHQFIRVTSDRYGHLFPNAKDALVRSMRHPRERRKCPISRPPRTFRGHQPKSYLFRTRKDEPYSWLTCTSVESGRRDSNPRPSPWQGDADKASASLNTV